MRTRASVSLIVPAACAALLLATPAFAAKKAKAKAPPAAPAAETETPAAPAPDAPAPTPPLDDMPDADKACKKELETHCANLTPGGARVARCLRENKARNGEGCNKALYAYLKQRFLEVCGPDMKKHCQAESQQQGALMPCMQAHGDALSTACKEELGLAKPAPAPAPSPAK